KAKQRRWIVWTLIVLAFLVLVIGTATVWVKRQALDTDHWTNSSTELLQDDQIRQALSVYIVDQLYDNVDVSQRLQQRLPSNLQGLAGPISAALREPATRAVDQLLQRPRIQKAWEDANRLAHQELMAILNGQPRPNISTAN